MSEVSFDEDRIQPTRQVVGPKGMAGWLIRNRFASNETTANIVLIAVALLIVFGAFMVWVSMQPEPHVMTPFEKDLFDRMQHGGALRQSS